MTQPAWISLPVDQDWATPQIGMNRVTGGAWQIGDGPFALEWVPEPDLKGWHAAFAVGVFLREATAR